MAISRDPVFFRLMQTALQKANPSGLPSNQVITQFSMPNETLYANEAVLAMTIQQGYPYGWGEIVATNGVGTYNLTEPMSESWILRMNAQKGSTDSVNLIATIGAGTAFAVQRIDPAAAVYYADNCFTWSAASILGQVGYLSWGTPGSELMQQLWPLASTFSTAPPQWTDMNAMWMGPTSTSATSEQVGQWLLKKWVYFPNQGTYTFSLCGDDAANLFVDGVSVVSGATYTEPSTGTNTVSAGWHLVTISCINKGSHAKRTGVLLSITSAQGTIIENGSDSHLIGTTWQTSGFINPTWTTVNSEDDMRHSWYMIPASDITSSSVALQVSATGSPAIHGIWWYNVAPWKWSVGGQWNASASSSTPAQVEPYQSSEVVS